MPHSSSLAATTESNLLKIETALDAVLHTNVHAHCMPAEVLHCLFSTLTWRNIAGTVLALQRVLVHFN